VLALTLVVGMTARAADDWQKNEGLRGAGGEAWLPQLSLQS
jgi:hypothetical protein